MLPNIDDLVDAKDTEIFNAGGITAFVVLYPWVCVYNSYTNNAAYWGDDKNWPGIPGLPYKQKTYQVDCR